MADIARNLAEGYPKESQRRVHWAYALREMDRVKEAKDVALKGLDKHPDEAILHFNLA